MCERQGLRYRLRGETKRDRGNLERERTSVSGQCGVCIRGKVRERETDCVLQIETHTFIEKETFEIQVERECISEAEECVYNSKRERERDKKAA